MSVIFPTSPASVRIKLLPKNAEFISYEFINRTLKLKAWIPGGIYSFAMISSQSALSRFYTEHCDGCERNTRDYIENLFDEEFYCESEIPDLMEENGECTVYFRGERECVNCPLNYTINEDEDAESHPISNSVVVETLIYNDRYGDIFDSVGFNVHLRAADFDENGLIRATSAYQSANVHPGDRMYSGNVCWGNTNEYNRPKNLREATAIYFNSEFNNDLLNLTTFKDYNEGLEIRKNQNLYEDSEEDKFICAGYDALMCIEAQKDVQAFYTMLTAGFRPIPELPNIMFIPLEESSIQKDDNFYFGYLTKPDAVGRQWYVSSEGYLLGQLDESFVKI